MAFASERFARPFLPFRDVTGSLRDIAGAIEMIERFTAGMDFEAFREDPKTISAVERKLLVISEAAIRLGSDAEELIPGPSWRDIRGLGNWLRHQYDRIDPETIWETYYNAHLFQGFTAGLDAQHVNNPAYNQDRGPVWIGSVRVHIELSKDSFTHRP